VPTPVRAAANAAIAHPRHVALAAFVAGLLAAPISRLGLVLAAAFALLAAPRPRLALLAAGLVVAGAGVAQARLASLDRSVLRAQLGEEVRLAGYVLEPPRSLLGETGRGGRPLGPTSATVRLSVGAARGERVSVLVDRWPRVDVGAEVVASGRLAPLRERDGWLRRRGVHARLLADSVFATGRRRGGIARALDRLRARAEAAAGAGLDPLRAALARGMVLGRDDGLTREARDDFRDSGLAHLLAASGQNVALLVALAIPVLAALGFGLRGRLLGAILAIAVYVPLAGAGPSIQRAGVMGAAAIVATLASRRASRWYAVLLAAAITLLANPRAAGDPGWQLSFAAVVAIAALAPRLSAWLRARGVPAGLAEATAVSVAATAATAPLLALHFERVSLVSLPANLVAGAAVAPTMWLGMAAVVVGTVSLAAAATVNQGTQLPLAFVGWVAETAAAMPYASVAVAGAPSGAQVALAALLAAGVSVVAAGVVARRASRGRAGRWGVARLAPPAAAVALAAALALYAEARPPAPPDPRTLVVSFLDVGQGDATLIQRGGFTALFDTGPPGSPILARLREAGVRRIDLLVVTHAQADHEGGTVAVLERHPVGVLLDGGHGAATPAHRAIVAAAAREGVRREVPAAGHEIRAGPLQLRILWPPPEPPEAHAGEDPNLRAVVAHVRDGDFDLLLPADAESEVTAALELPRVEALKVAHHGSADPGLPDLVARLAPRLAVIEVGEGNRYGHPAPQALSALRGVPVVRRTDRDGTVRLAVRDGAMQVQGAGGERDRGGA
jgi:competence protein ComEC